MPTLHRINWIDSARGLCMTAILYDHTEIYYANDNIIPYEMYVINALTAFFFISGFLFWKEKPFQIKNKMKSIFRSLVIPYFIFTTAMAVPKAMVHGENIEITNIIKQILSGNASWFIAALIIAELIFACILYLGKEKTSITITCSVILFFIGLSFNKTNLSIPWNAHIASLSVFFIAAGYLYHRFNHFLVQYVNGVTMALAFAVLCVCKWMECQYGLKMMMFGLQIDNTFIFLTDSLLFIFPFIYIVQRLPQIKLILYVGRHSMVYYFLCGGIPLLTGKMFNAVSLTYSSNHLLLLPVFVCVLVISTIATRIICKFVKTV